MRCLNKSGKEIFLVRWVIVLMFVGWQFWEIFSTFAIFCFSTCLQGEPWHPRYHGDRRTLEVSSQVSQSLGDHVISRETSFKSGALQTAFFLLFSIQRCLDVARKNVKEHSDDLRWLLQMVAFRPLNNIHSWSLCFKLLHEFHKTCHETCLQTMLWHYNARVNSHQRWKQTRFRVCFHLWCELTSTMNVPEWQV